MLAAGYTFGGLSTPGNGTSDAVLPIVECHSTLACAGGGTSFQCFPGYTDTRFACKRPICPGRSAARLPSSRELLAGALLRGFGCRCGACDVGYYGVSGQCRECGDKSLVLFLAYAVPILMILALSCFLFWSGTFALPRHLQRPCLVAWVMAIQ